MPRYSVAVLIPANIEVDAESPEKAVENIQEGDGDIVYLDPFDLDNERIVIVEPHSIADMS